MENYSDFMFACESYMDDLQEELAMESAMESYIDEDYSIAIESIADSLRSGFTKLKRAVKKGDKKEAAEAKKEISEAADELDKASKENPKKKGLSTAAKIGLAAAATAAVAAGLYGAGKQLDKKSREENLNLTGISKVLKNMANGVDHTIAKNYVKRADKLLDSAQSDGYSGKSDSMHKKHDKADKLRQKANKLDPRIPKGSEFDEYTSPVINDYFYTNSKSAYSNQLSKDVEEKAYRVHNLGSRVRKHHSEIRENSDADCDKLLGSVTTDFLTKAEQKKYRELQESIDEYGERCRTDLMTPRYKSTFAKFEAFVNDKNKLKMIGLKRQEEFYNKLLANLRK